MNPPSIPGLPSGTIAVLMGGPGSERDVSLRTGESITRALVSEGLPAVAVVVDGSGFALPAGTGLAFIAIHGTYGEDGGIQAELETRGIPYTGAGVAASRLAFDKLEAKRAFLAACARAAPVLPCLCRLSSNRPARDRASACTS
jgi:D-alanine-D-alanine ligase